jgi:hypothetical protein
MYQGQTNCCVSAFSFSHSLHHLTNLKILCSQAPELLELLFFKGIFFSFVISTFSIYISNIHAFHLLYFS